MMKFLQNRKKELLLALGSAVLTLFFVVGIMEMIYAESKGHGIHTQFDAEIGWAPIPEKKSSRIIPWFRLIPWVSDPRKWIDSENTFWF